MHRLADEQLPAILGNMHLEVLAVAQVHALAIGYAGQLQHAVRTNDVQPDKQLALDNALVQIAANVHLAAFGLVLVFQEEHRLVDGANGARDVFFEHPHHVFTLPLHFQPAADLVGIDLPQHRAPDHGDQEQAE